MLLTNFENLNSILKIFQETLNFLVLPDPVILCNYLSTTGRHFRDQGKVRHPTSKLVKCDLVQTLNTSRNPDSRIFAAGIASLAKIWKCNIRFHKMRKRNEKQKGPTKSETLLFWKKGCVVSLIHIVFQQCRTTSFTRDFYYPF